MDTALFTAARRYVAEYNICSTDMFQLIFRCDLKSATDLIEALHQENYVTLNGDGEYQPNLTLEELEVIEEREGIDSTTLVGDPPDPLYPEALESVLRKKMASTSLLQRELIIGYSRAARIIDYMDANNLLGPFDDKGKRSVTFTADDVAPELDVLRGRDLRNTFDELHPKYSLEQLQKDHSRYQSIGNVCYWLSIVSGWAAFITIIMAFLSYISWWWVALAWLATIIFSGAFKEYRKEASLVQEKINTLATH